MLAHQVEDALFPALEAARGARGALSDALEALDVAAYATDADGVVTHFNAACAPLAGRQPQPGEDRWCVTWRLHTEDGTFLPHAECPMAVAIKERRPVRGQTALAERPDGTRVRFMPFPTPVLSERGELMGALNVLLEVSDAAQAQMLRQEARRARRLRATINDVRSRAELLAMAEEYEARAAALESRSPH